jgi:hypothetical protein
MDAIAAAGLASAAKAVDAAGAEGAKVAGNILTRLLGPSADVIGSDWAERLKQRNLARLLDKTQRRAEGSGAPGFTTPRLAAATFEAAQYADDEIVADYLSGVLSSSRAPEGGDDGGLPWSSAIARLSSLQLRLHYMVYLNARALIAPQDDHFWKVQSRTVMMPFQQILDALGLGEGSQGEEAKFDDAASGLRREGLLGEVFGHGPVKFFEEHDQIRHSYRQTRKRLNVSFSGDVVELEITDHGLRLYLWGLGRGTDEVDVYMDETEPLELVDPQNGLGLLEGVVLSESAWI